VTPCAPNGSSKGLRNNRRRNNNSYMRELHFLRAITLLARIRGRAG
jgi:hypothetical protein